MIELEFSWSLEDTIGVVEDCRRCLGIFMDPTAGDLPSPMGSSWIFQLQGIARAWCHQI